MTVTVNNNNGRSVYVGSDSWGCHKLKINLSLENKIEMTGLHGCTFSVGYGFIFND